MQNSKTDTIDISSREQMRLETLLNSVQTRCTTNVSPKARVPGLTRIL